MPATPNTTDPAGPEHAVVLLSGGLDSATCLAIARERGREVHCLSFDYGQRHIAELRAANEIARVMGVASHRTAKIDLRAFGGSALTDDTLDVPKDRTEADMSATTFAPEQTREGQREISSEHDAETAALEKVSEGADSERTPNVAPEGKTASRRGDSETTPKANFKANSGGGSVVVGGGADEIPITYVPARNTIFLSYALALAEVLGSTDLFIGVNAVDYSGYPDCRPEFIDAFERMANLATKAGVTHAPGSPAMRIHTPLIDLPKPNIIQLGLGLGVDYALTHSCYDPLPDDPLTPAASPSFAPACEGPNNPTDATPASVSPDRAMPTSALPTDATPANVSPDRAIPTSALPTDATPANVSPDRAMPTSAIPTGATPANTAPASATPIAQAASTSSRVPEATSGGGKPCGHCDACLLRIRAFEQLGQRDPAMLRHHGQAWTP